MNPGEDAAVAVDFRSVWRAVAAWDRNRPKSLEFAGCRVRLYLGAMEIPMLAFRPRAPVTVAVDHVAAWGPLLARFGLVLDCVTPGENYKLNRRDTGEYVGRVLPDALKFHAARILDIGEAALAEIAALYLRLPPAGASS